MTHIQPLNQMVLIRPDMPEARTKDGLHIPEQALERPCTGIVISYGPSTNLQLHYGTDPSNSVPGEGVSFGGVFYASLVRLVRAGWRVLYPLWGGTPVEHEGKPHLLIKYDDLLAVLEDEEEDGEVPG